MKNTTTTTNKWEKTKVAGIRRYAPTGSYHFQKKIAGRVFAGSLDTHDFPTAKLKFIEKVAELTKSIDTWKTADPLAALAAEAVTLGDLAAVYCSRIAGGEGDLDNKTVKKRRYVLRSLRASWITVPGFAQHGRFEFNSVKPHDLTYDDLVAWRSHFLTGLNYSPDYFNKTVQLLKALFQIAIEKGCQIPRDRARNLTAVERLTPAKVQRKEYTLPTAEIFAKILAYGADTYKNGFSRHCRDLVEGVSWTGLRKSEAQGLKKDFINLDRNFVALPAALCKGRKGTKKGRTIPILPDARPFFARLVEKAAPDGRVFHVDECPFWLEAACKEVGWTEKFTLHSVRHYFATRCLEAGIPVQTVASYLGHRDKGKLLLEVYAHICEKHALECAEHIHGWKNTTQPANVVPIAKAA
jgi:integrase